MKKIDITGKIYGRLTVLKFDEKSNKWSRWICKCECGKEKSILGTHLRYGRIRSCGCLNDETRGMSQAKYIGEISASWWDRVRHSASGGKGKRKRGEVPLTIDQQYAWDLFLKQERKCALTGVELKFPKNGKDNNGTASLDRIESSKGYEDGNVQWVHKDVNRMKNIYSQERFIQVCRLVSDNFKEIK